MARSGAAYASGAVRGVSVLLSYHWELNGLAGEPITVISGDEAIGELRAHIDIPPGRLEVVVRFDPPVMAVPAAHVADD